MNKSKFIAALLVAVLISFNVLNVPYNIEAVEVTEKLGVNLYENEGFEKSNYMAPFKQTVADAFKTCKIQSDIGVDGSKGLRLISVLHHACCIEHYFDTEAGKSYRVWLTAKNGSESTENYLGMGLRNYPDYSNSNENAQQGVYFTTNEYETKYMDFTVGDKNSKVKIYILVGKTQDNHRGSAYVDDFVLEVTAERPTIDEILDPLTATLITGTAKPGAKVEITLPNSTIKETIADDDGKYSVTIDEGSLDYAQTVSAVQYGLYGLKSSAATVTTKSRAQRLLGKNMYTNPEFENPDNIVTLFTAVKSSVGLFDINGIREGIGIDGSKGYEILGSKPYSVCMEYYFPVEKHHNYRSQVSAKVGKDAGYGFEMGVRYYRLATTDPSDKLAELFENKTDFETKWINFQVTRNDTANPTTRVHLLAGDYVPSPDLRGHVILDNYVFEKTAYPPTINEITNAQFETAISGTSEPTHDVTIKVTRGSNTILEEIVPTSEYSGIYSLSINPGTLEPGDTITAIQHGLAENPFEEKLPGAKRIMSYPTTITALDKVAPDPPKVIVVKDTDKTIEGTAEAGSTVTITFSDGSTLSAIAGADSSFSIDLEGRSLTAGESVSLTATDASKNVSAETKKTVIETSKTTINEEDNIGIYAKNFAVKLSEVGNIENATILERSMAKLFKLSDGSILEVSQLSVNQSSLEDEIGVYPVVLSLEDTNRIVYAFVVNETYILDETKDVIITAEDFSVSLGAVPKLTDPNILLLSRAKAWTLSTGKEITPLTINRGSLTADAVAGEYNITFSASGLDYSRKATVEATDRFPPKIMSIDIIGPEITVVTIDENGEEKEHKEIYTNSANSWVNENVILEIIAVDDVKIDQSSYKVSYGDKDSWEDGNFSIIDDNKATLTIDRNAGNQTIFVMVSDTSGNKSEASGITQINIDKIKPYSENYIDGAIYYNTSNLEAIKLKDDLSGIYSATLNDTDILSGQTKPKSGENTLIITDKAGNVSEISFFVVLDTKVTITGNISNGDDNNTIERGTRKNPIFVTAETSVILKNTTTSKEYIGILTYGNTLTFKEIGYGRYEVLLINPPDILSTGIDIPEFELTGGQKDKEIAITSEYVTLNGFGNIVEINTP